MNSSLIVSVCVCVCVCVCARARARACSSGPCTWWTTVEWMCRFLEKSITEGQTWTAAKGLKEDFVTVMFMTLSHLTASLCVRAKVKQSLLTESWTSDVLSVEEQQNVYGSKCGRAAACLVFCLLPPHSASRTALSFCSPSKADHDRNVVSFKATDVAEVTLSALAFTKCPSTESRRWIQHLVAMNYWQKMSLITIWFHNIQIFVLFIYYIYWNITLCAGM